MPDGQSVMAGRGNAPSPPKQETPSQRRRRLLEERRAAFQESEDNQPARFEKPRRAAAFLVRGGTALVPGAWPGAIAGGLGEAAGQIIEPGVLEGRRDFNPTQVGVQAGLGAIPFGRVSSIPRAMAKGGLMGASSALITEQAGDRGLHMPDAQDAEAAAYGGTFGALGAGAMVKGTQMFNKWRAGKANPPDILDTTIDTRPSGGDGGGGISTRRIPERTSAPRTVQGEVVDEMGRPYDAEGQVINTRRPQPLPADRQLTTGPGQGDGFEHRGSGDDLGFTDDVRSATLGELRAYRGDPASFTPQRAQALADNLTRHIGTPNALDTAAGIYEGLPKSTQTSPYTRTVTNQLSSLPDHLASRARQKILSENRTIPMNERAPEINRDQAIRTRAQGVESIEDAMAREPKPGAQRPMFGRQPSAKRTLGGKRGQAQQQPVQPDVESRTTRPTGLQDVAPVREPAAGEAPKRALEGVPEGSLTFLAKSGQKAAINELKARGVWDRIKASFGDETGAIGDVAGARERRAAQLADMEARQTPADRQVSDRRVTELNEQFRENRTARNPPDAAVSNDRFRDLLTKLGGRGSAATPEPKLPNGIIKSGELSPDYAARLRTRDQRSPAQILSDVMKEMSGGRTGGLKGRLGDETGAVGQDITGVRHVERLDPDEWSDLADSIDDEIVRAANDPKYADDLRSLQRMIREKMPQGTGRMKPVQDLSSFSRGTDSPDVPSSNRGESPRETRDRFKVATRSELPDDIGTLRRGIESAKSMGDHEGAARLQDTVDRTVEARRGRSPLRHLASDETGSVNLKDIKESVTGKSAGDDDLGKSYIREDYTMSMNEELQRMGKNGKEIYRRLARADQFEQQYNARWANKYKEVTQHLTDDEIENLVDVIEKGVKPKTQGVKDAVPVIRQVFSDIGDEATKMGVHYVTGSGEKIPFQKHGADYWPRVPKEKGDALVEKLMKADPVTGEKMTRAEAQKVERLYRRYGELIMGAQHQRLNRQFDYKKTRDVAQLHIEGMSRLIARNRTVGPKDVAGAADGIANLIEGTPDPARTLKLLERHLGREDARITPAMNKVVRKLRTYAVWTKLQNFAVANVLGGQSNIVLRSKPGVYMKEVVKYLGRDLEQRAITSEAGALAEISHGMLEELSKFNPTRLYGIKATENINRTIASGVGRGMAQEYFKTLLKDPTNKLARTRLFELALEDVDKLLKQKSLTEEQLRMAAGRMAEITQGLNVKRNLPHGWADDHPLVQIATTFKKYAFQGTKATWDAIKQDPKRNLPLFLGIGQLVGMGIGASKSAGVGAWRSVFEGKDPRETIGEEVGGRADYVKKNFGIDNNILARVIDNAFQSFAFGIPADIIQAAAGSKTGLTEMVAGPLAGDVSRLGSDVVDIPTGHAEAGLRDVAKMGARSLPLPMGGGQAAAKQFNDDETNPRDRGARRTRRRK